MKHYQPDSGLHQKKYSNITLFHVNCQGLSNKLDELNIFISSHNFDVIGLTEHWYRNNDLESLVIPDYNLISHFSREHHSHGGSAIFVKNSKNSSTYDLNQFSVECHYEVCGAKYVINNCEMCIVCVYRPGTGNFNIFEKQFTSTLTFAFRNYKNLIITGDFNIHYEKQSDNNTKVFLDILNSFELNITCFEPTRIFTNIKGVTSVSTIDYMITSFDSANYECYVLDPLLSDHKGHYLTLQVNLLSESPDTNTFPSIKIRDICNSNLNNLYFQLNNVDWGSYYKLTDVNEVCKTFIENIKWALEVCCPLIYIKDMSQRYLANKWYTSDVALLHNKLKELHRLKRISNSDQLKDTFSKYKKHFKSEVRKSKRKHFNNRVDNAENKVKESWKIINEKLGRTNKQTQSISLLHNDTIVTEAKDVSNLFASHFSSVTSHMIQNHFHAGKSTDCTGDLHVSNSIFVPYICVENVETIINKIKNKNCAGVDNLSQKIIKSIKPVILDSLTYLINISLEKGIFPDPFKLALIIPLHKKGERNNIDNYRQISLLSEVSKILERIVYDIINDFNDKYNILTLSQHGFRKNKSVETASTNLLTHVYNELDKGNYVISIMFDLAKAFDSLNHNLILTKLNILGIRGTLLEWIKSYLEQRKLLVRVDSIISDTYPVSLGVPQGSVLGPLLFLLFINDLPKHITGKVIMFADDTTVTVAGKSLEELQENARRVFVQMETWCYKNSLILNKDKTVSLHFHLSRSLPTDITHNFPFKFDTHTKLLGTWLDANMSFEHHISHVCNQLNKAFYAILHMKDYLDEKRLIDLYYAFAFCHLSYNILSWGKSVHNSRVFVAQKRILRLIFNLKPYESCKNIFKNKSILTFPSIYIFKCVTFTRQNISDFTRQSDIHYHNTRYNNLRLPPFSTSAFKRSPIYNCITLYNALPEEFKEASTYTVFKRRVKKFLQDKAFYSIHEYMSH